MIGVYKVVKEHFCSFTYININANQFKSRIVENSKRFYTYAYLREDGSPYYIGKGTGNRIYSKNRCGNLPKDKTRIIFLKTNLTEEEAFKHEIYMIAVFGRKDLGTGILRNKTDGGDGASGAIVSEETKKKLSQLNKGKIISDKTRKKLSALNTGENNPNYGKKHSKETKRKISEAQKGEKNHNYGKPLSEETKKKQSEALRGENHPFYGKKHSEETKRKLSIINRGKNHPLYGKSHLEETRKKIQESNKGKKWWNDGYGNNIRAKECPGERWFPGMGKRKVI